MAEAREPVMRHEDHDVLLLAGLASGDAQGSERERAEELVDRCADCRQLLADVRAIRTATQALPAVSRPRDFRLTREDADRLRSRRGSFGATVGRLLGGGPAGYGGTGGVARPFAAALTALGLAGLLFASLPIGAPTAAPAGQTNIMAPGAGGAAPDAPAAASAAPLAASAVPGTGTPGALGGVEAAGSHTPEMAGEATDTTRQNAAGPDTYGATAGTDARASGPLDPVSGPPVDDRAAGATGPTTALPSGTDAIRPVIAAASVALVAAGVVLLFATRSRGRPAG